METWHIQFTPDESDVFSGLLKQSQTEAGIAPEKFYAPRHIGNYIFNLGDMPTWLLFDVVKRAKTGPKAIAIRILSRLFTNWVYE